MAFAAVESTGDHAALLARAREQQDLGDLRGAEATCGAALSLRPDDAEAHRLMGSILLLQNRGDDAVRSLRESIRLDPSGARAHKKLAQAYAAQGRIEDAVAADREALRLQPEYAGALAHLAGLKRFTSPDDEDLARIELLLENGALADDARAVLLFALANALEGLGSYERAFELLREANALFRRFVTWDRAAGLHMLERTCEVFSKELLERLGGAGSTSELPVLIVGMPRSGTTLVEQIVASHPAAYGGGERPDLLEIASVLSVMTDEGLPFPDSVEQVRPDVLAGLAEGYTMRLRDLAPEAERVTDKTPRNFRHLGLLRLLLPNAKVIHCVRDPVDTCFSCYTLTMIAQPYTFDLVELGEYYRGYTQLMEHWRDVLPPGWILDVRYEDLVDDLESGCRRIIDHCGLEWDDACLRFHSTDRTVTTSSVTQVRRPVYRSSIGRGRRFEPYLGDLLTALGEPAPPPPASV